MLVHQLSSSLTRLLGIQIPIIQGGMVWVSGWKLASAVSNAGALGVIGAGSMHPDNLRHHIQSCKQATQNPYAVNIPLLYPEMDALIEIIIQEKVPIVITSAGSPAKYTAIFKANGCKVLHVVSSAAFAKKAEAAGVDAVIAEGFEAGGHNGREETTTLVLVPLVVASVNIPVVAAGGIGSGAQMAAAIALGAQGVQMGSKFICTHEASAHRNFQEKILQAGEGETQLCMKNYVPVRLLKNAFYQQVQTLENTGASKEQLVQLLGKGRAKKGMFLGDVVEGELEVGQVAASIQNIVPAAQVVQDTWQEFQQTLHKLTNHLL